MKTTNSHIRMLGLGLSLEEAERIRDAATGMSEEAHATLTTAPENSPLPNSEEQRPDVLWISWSAWKSLSLQEKENLNQAKAAHETVLLLGAKYSRSELQQAIESAAVTLIPSPPEPGKIRDILLKRKELSDIHSDIMRMAREIYLEREMLARKNEQLSFINRFLTRVSQSLDPLTILVNARENLGMLLPIKAMQAIFWFDNDNDVPDAEIFLAGTQEEHSTAQWQELLLSSAARLAGRSVSGYRVTWTPDLAVAPQSPLSPPRAGHNLILPFKTGEETFGCAVLLLDAETNLGRDHVQMLQSSIAHLSLALRNGFLFREARTEADHDGLTRLHNRMHFDRRIREEVSRSQRYGQEMSLLIIDLDHFKRINDAYGHPAGDEVLKEAGRIIAETIRTTDYAARYGGEEFVVLLPHTDEEHARILGERLCSRIAAHSFTFDGEKVRVTASVGIATQYPGCSNCAADLVSQADQALYMAKSGGRNQVMTSGVNLEAVMQ